MTTKHLMETTISLLAIALLAVAPGAQANQYWWVGPCNGTLVGSQFGDAVEYADHVQADPITATGEAGASTEANALNYSSCVAAGTDRIQIVAPGRSTDIVVVEDCRVACWFVWESLDELSITAGSPSLTLRCLDDGETVTWVGNDRPPLNRSPLHPCIVESTLQLNGAAQSVVVWGTILVP